MKNLGWIAAASLTVLPWGAHAVTFDCAKARSAPEKLICATPDLSQADDHLKQSFEAARARATDKKAFNDRAKQEWQRREKTCTDAACVRQWYADQERLYAAPAAATIATPTQPVPKPVPATAAAPSSVPAAAHPAAPQSAPQSAPDSRPASAQQPAASAAPAGNAPEVAATVLYTDYQQSESAADRKYKGKTIKISGTVAAITAPANGDPYIELTAADSAMPKVHLDFPKAASARIAEIKKGQKISLPCVGQGLVIGDPVLSCTDAP